jgi:hypothetical protein
MLLTALVRSSSHSPSRRKGEPRRGWLARCTLVGIAVFVAQILSLERADSASYYKQYAYIELNYNIEQFDCLNALYHHESRWSPTARNGSHYGIPQGRSKYLQTATPYQQIRWGLKYIANRYGVVEGVPNACGAYNHWKLKRWH